jgi:hypothetical protein
MKINQRTFARAARIATRRAILALLNRGFNGEAQRARIMQDSWLKHAEEILGRANYVLIEQASALKVCRQLTRSIKMRILQTEIETRLKKVGS